MSRLIVIVVILIVLATQHHCSAFRSRGSSWRSIRLRELAIHAAPSSAELRREKQQSSKTAKTVLNRANDIADNDLSDGDIESSLHDKKVNLLAFLPIPALLFGGYELANAGNIIIDPSQASVVGSYWRYFLAGAISCSFSHLVTVPFDVVKTRIQLETEKIGIMDMGKRLAAEEGISSFLTGE